MKFPRIRGKVFVCLLIIYFFHIHENIQAGTSQAGTSKAGTSQAGTSQARTSQAGTSQAGTSQARTSQVGTSQQGMSQPETSQNLSNSTWPSPNFAINEETVWLHRQRERKATKERENYEQAHCSNVYFKICLPGKLLR